MATLFYDSFQNTNNWVGGNSQSPTITVVQDPNGQYQKVVNFASVRNLPDSFSSVINNNFKSFTLSFDYLGLPKSQQTAVNLGCVISIADGASLTGRIYAYAGAVKNDEPPLTPYREILYLCRLSASYGSACRDNLNEGGYLRLNSFSFLEDNSQWHHYSIAFSTNNNNIRIALSDYVYANTPESNTAGDCYFANLLVTDSYGPSPFIATSNPENFRSISVDVLNQVADTVSYINSNAAVNINLGGNYTSGGFAAGDVLNDIKNIIGSGFNDVLAGSGANNQLEGGNGNDMLTAGLGNDILIGGSGVDTFVIANEITSAKINDLEIGVDKIDLRLFNGFYSLSIIKASSTYTNGNTVINLGSGKLLTLQNINPADLTEATFLLPDGPTAQPTLQPTTASPSYSMSPSPMPTTASPTFSPTASPSAAPTTSHPTFSPSTTSPSYSPSAIPTEKPSPSPTQKPSAAPTINPTETPTLQPSFRPSPSPSSNKHILTNSDSEYVGGPFYEEITVNSIGNLKLTLNGGGDRITMFSNAFSETTITDFTPEDGSIIDISVFEEVASFNDLRKLMSFTGGTVITFSNKQKIILQNVPLSRLKADSFEYSSGSTNDDDGTDPGISVGTVVGIAVGSVAGVGIMAAGGVYYAYKKGQQSSNSNSNSQKLEVNNHYHHTPDPKRVVPIAEEIRAVHEIKYNNPALNIPGALELAVKNKGTEGVDALINIGLDKNSFDNLKEQINVHGLEKGIADSIARNEIMSANLKIATTYQELNQVSEYIPSAAYVLRDIFYPKMQDFVPRQVEYIFDTFKEYGALISTGIHFVTGNLASYYSGSSYLESSINSALYATKYYAPAFIHSLIPEWVENKCVFSAAYNGALIVGKSYLSASLPSYLEVISSLAAVAPQCVRDNQAAKLNQDSQDLVDIIDMAALGGLFAFTNFNDKNLIERIGEVLSVAPSLMLVDMSAKAILSSKAENESISFSECVGECQTFESINEL